jgi:two-component system, cell cycle sensor histidine kinase and response regulator CckA
MMAVPDLEDTATQATVLVADDDHGVRTLVRMLLQRAGYTVVQAASGREAYETMRDRGHEVDVVLLDVMMPEMDGHEALPAMRGIDPEVPVVFFSGFDQTEVAEHLTGTGAYTSFIPKPFEKEELIGEIARALRSRR